MVAVLEPEMKKKGRPKSERDDKAVKVDRAIASMAAKIAGHLGISVAEVISEAARESIRKSYAKMLRELEADPAPKKGGSKS